MAKTIKTIKDGREKMSEVFSKLEARKTDLGSAKAMCNCFGKQISSVKVQLEYAKLRKETPQIDFMKCN